MEQTNVTEIRLKIQDALKASKNAYEAEAWANALKSFMIALGIQKDLELKLAKS